MLICMAAKSREGVGGREEGTANRLLPMMQSGLGWATCNSFGMLTWTHRVDEVNDGGHLQIVIFLVAQVKLQLIPIEYNICACMH